MTPTDLSVVVVTYNPDDVLDGFLESLTSTFGSTVPVVLADNASLNGVPEEAAKKFPNVEVVPTGGNLGFGQGANVGVSATNTEWVVVANPDIVWTSGALTELLAATTRWPRAGSLGPLIRDVDGELYPSARELPSLGRGIGHAIFGWWWPGNTWTQSYRRERGDVQERTAGWLSGSCILIRREAFDSVSGFDPAFFMYFEDLDLGERLGRAGWQNVYVPSAEVTHIGGTATSRNKSRMLIEHHRSAYIYLSRRYTGRRWLLVRAALKAGLALRVAVVRRIPWER